METNMTSNITATTTSALLSLSTAAAVSKPGKVFQTDTARITVYSLIIIISFLGNALLVLTISLTRRMRTTTNYFLLNMAVGDLLVAAICAPYQLASWKHPTIKTFNRHICKVMPFIQMSTVGVSIFTMIAIAVDRYLAVLYPLSRRMTKRICVVVVMAIWMATIALAVPMVFAYEIKTFPKTNDTDEFPVCGEFGWTDPQRDAVAYTYALFVLQYALPGVLVAYLYLRIFLHLWFYKFPGMQDMSKENRLRYRQKHYRRKKTLIMLLSVFFAFMLCNLPMHVISFIHFVEGSDFKPPPYMPLIAMGSEMAMYANSALNPVLYGFLHKKFKASSIALLKWLLCKARRPNFENILQAGKRANHKKSSTTAYSQISAPSSRSISRAVSTTTSTETAV